jgi:phytoene dehydrogenase-like protein
MLEGRYIDAKIRGYYETLPVFPPLVFVSLGVNRPFDGMPHSITYMLDEPISIGSRQQTSLIVQIHNFDPKLAPPGKTVINVMIGADYNEWKDLYGDSKRYNEAKDAIAHTIIQFLDRRFPGLAEQIEMVNVATPVTWERFTGNWKGSYEGWLPPKDNLNMHMSKTLPGLSSFYMAGQWVEPGGGLPPAAFSGRHVIQMLCKKEGKKFTASIPGNIT